jgi:hypothetical protein
LANQDVTLRAQHCSPRAGEKARLDEKLHHVGLDDGRAVEALDRKPLRPSAPDMRDEGVESRAKPLGIGLSKWDERSPAALHEEHRLAAEQDDPCAGNPRSTSAGASRPRNRGAVWLRRIGCGEHERVAIWLTHVGGSQLAQALDGARDRELRSSEALDEVSAPAHPERLEHTELGVDGPISTTDALATHSVARDNAVSLQEKLGERASVRLAGEQRGRKRPSALSRRGHGRP